MIPPLWLSCVYDGLKQPCEIVYCGQLWQLGRSPLLTVRYSKKTTERSTLSFHTSFLIHCLGHGITLIVNVILQTTDHANFLCFVSITWNLHACLYVYTSGMDKFSHPTLALPPCNGAVPYLSKFWLLTKPSVPNSKSNFVEARASQCLQLVCTHRNWPAARPIRNPDNPRLVCKPV